MHEDHQKELTKLRKDTGHMVECTKAFSTELKAKPAEGMAKVAAPPAKKHKGAPTNRTDRVKVGAPELDERLTEERLSVWFLLGARAMADT